MPVFVQHARDERQLWRLVGAIFSLAGAGLRHPGGRAWRSSPTRWSASSAAASPSDEQRAAGRQPDAHRADLGRLPGPGGRAHQRAVRPEPLRAARLRHRDLQRRHHRRRRRCWRRPLGVPALAVGLIIGALAQFLLQASGLRAFWRAYRPRIDLADPARAPHPGARRHRRRRAWSSPSPASSSTATWRRRLPEGSLSSMEYATRVIQFPLGIVGLAVSFAILPTLSRFNDGADGEPGGYREALVFGLKLVLLLMLPALAVLAALSHPLIAVVFERSAFTARRHAQRTAAIFLFYSPMLPLTAVDYLLINAFYARQNARTPGAGRRRVRRDLPGGGADDDRPAAGARAWRWPTRSRTAATR